VNMYYCPPETVEIFDRTISTFRIAMGEREANSLGQAVAVSILPSSRSIAELQRINYPLSHHYTAISLRGTGLRKPSLFKEPNFARQACL
jgi:hypothetical protein